MTRIQRFRDSALMRSSVRPPAIRVPRPSSPGAPQGRIATQEARSFRAAGMSGVANAALDATESLRNLKPRP
jgi:hypothetical protein